MNIQKRTGYSELRETKKISRLYCSSQCCASGTRSADKTSVKELSKMQKVETNLSVLSKMRFERY